MNVTTTEKINYRFVTEDLRREFHNMDWRVRLLLREATEIARAMGYEALVTSIKRDDGIHSHWRAADVVFLRRPEAGAVDASVKASLGPHVADAINADHIYGLSWDHRILLCALWHENRGSEGMHLHLQVPRGPMLLTNSVKGFVE